MDASKNGYSYYLLYIECPEGVVGLRLGTYDDILFMVVFFLFWYQNAQNITTKRYLHISISFEFVLQQEHGYVHGYRIFIFCHTFYVFLHCERTEA